MDKQHVFPSKVAKGESFCNRTEEKKRLRGNMDKIQHTLLISPRRYGKTSLALKAIQESNLPYASIQFFNAFRDEIVIERFIEGLNGLFSQLLPKTKKAFLKFSEFIQHASVSLTVSGLNLSVGVKPLSKHPVDIVKGLLQDINSLLKKRGKSAVIFFDEFQDIVQSDLSDELQAALRDFAQLTDNVTFIISGSHRHLLAKMFDDSHKPFYKLFDRIDLRKIKRDDYTPFIQKQAKSRWNFILPDVVLSEILNITECHAYYVNRLCSKLWELDTLPTFKDVFKVWKDLVEEEFPSIANDLSSLTKNQRIVLQVISTYSYLKEPNGNEFLQKVGLSSRSVSLACAALEKSDHIEKTPAGLHVIDPVIKHILTC